MVINIIYSEKDAAVRRFFQIVMRQWKNCSIIAECSSPLELIGTLSQPALATFVLLGLDLPTYGDLVGIMILKNKFPALNIIGISQQIDKSIIKMAIAFKASSYLSMEDSETVFQNTFKTILAQGYCSNKYARERYFTEDLSLDDPYIGISDTGISDAEKRVLKLMPTGLTYEEIAGQLGISVKTVHIHREHLFGKLNVRSRQELAAIAMDMGLYKLKTFNTNIHRDSFRV